jgi:hypothetical protein
LIEIFWANQIKIGAVPNVRVIEFRGLFSAIEDYIIIEISIVEVRIVEVLIVMLGVGVSARSFITNSRLVNENLNMRLDPAELTRETSLLTDCRSSYKLSKDS